MTSSDYSSILQQKPLAKEVAKVIKQQKKKKKEDKKAQRVADSLIVVERITQRLLDKWVKVTFHANWSTIAIKEIGNKFHRNFTIGLKAHP